MIRHLRKYLDGGSPLGHDPISFRLTDALREVIADSAVRAELLARRKRMKALHYDLELPALILAHLAVIGTASRAHDRRMTGGTP